MRALGLWGPTSLSPASVVARLLAMQAQEHPYARWSVGQRVEGGTHRSAVDRAFDEGSILRTHVLRPTWHYVNRDDLRWLIGLSGPRVDAANNLRYRQLELDERTLARSNELIAATVEKSPHTRRELADVLEGGRISVAGQRLAHMLLHAELTGVICSGPMQGKQHTYAAFDQRVPPGNGPVGDEALRALALRYFTTRGPATLKDLVWWSGLNASLARRALDVAKELLSSRTLGDRTYWFNEQNSSRARRQVDLVQCYDEVIISYSESRDVLQATPVEFPVPRHIDGFTHVLLRDGRLLGHWRAVPRRDGIEVQTRILTALDQHDERRLAGAIEQYRRFLDAAVDEPSTP